MTDFYQALTNELSLDPLGRGYAGMNLAQLQVSFNAEDRPVDVERLTGAQIYDAIDQAEFASLAAGDKEVIDRITGLQGSVKITPGSRARVALQGALSGQTISLANLGALQTRNISRAAELGYGKVGVGFLHNAGRTS